MAVGFRLGLVIEDKAHWNFYRITYILVMFRPIVNYFK